MRSRWPGMTPDHSRAQHTSIKKESGGRSEQAGRTLRHKALLPMWNAQQCRGDRIHYECLQCHAGKMQAWTLALAALTAVGAGGRTVRGRITRMMERRRWLMARLMSGGELDDGGACGGHRGLSRFQVVRLNGGHGMAQLTDDQTGHQQKHQGPTLPEGFTHARRVQADRTSCNDSPHHAIRTPAGAHQCSRRVLHCVGGR